MEAMKILPSQPDEFGSLQLVRLGTLGVVQGVGDQGSKFYRYVRFVDAVTYDDGDVCTRASATTWNVTKDRELGSAIVGLEVAGIVHGVPAENDYGWVQCSGLSTCDGTFNAGDYLIPHATTDGAADSSGYVATKVDFNIFAKALAAGVVNIMGLV